MNSVASTALCWGRSTPRPSHSTPTTRPRFPPPTTSSSSSSSYSCRKCSSPRVRCATNGSDAPVAQEIEEDASLDGGNGPSASFDKNINRVVQKTAATFAPRASTASKNPAVPGTILYSLFELQGYASMVMGGALAFNLIFPSDEPDIWRLMGMWSVWMFTIPSLRARDCSKNEKEALNYLFLAIPLINVAIPFFWKSFAVVWSADVVAFFIMYAWKLGWLQKSEG